MKNKFLVSLLTVMLLFSCGNTPSTGSSSIPEINTSIDLSTLDKVYHNYNSRNNFEVEIDNLPTIYTLTIGTTLVKSDDYKINEKGNLIIRNDIVKRLNYGNYLLSINNKINFNLVVYDDRTPSLIGDSTIKVTLNKDPRFKFQFYDGVVSSIINNEQEVISYTSVTHEEIIISTDLIEKLGQGNKTYNIHIDQDTPNGIVRTTIDVNTYYPKSTGDTIII